LDDPVLDLQRDVLLDPVFQRGLLVL
jgi:hypothetical protein